MSVRTALQRKPRIEPLSTFDAPSSATPATGSPLMPGARRRRRRRRIALVGGAGLTAVWLVGWYSPLTTVEHVVVTASRGLSETQIRKASGIASNDHVPAVSEAEVRRLLLSAMPAVADVQLTRSLPHTIRLVVTARQPLAVLPQGAGFIVIDRDGVQFDRLQAPGQLPLIGETDPARQQVARTILAILPEEMRKHVALITAATPDAISMTLRDGAQVIWGSNEDGALKASVLAALLTSKAAHYDLSAPMLPTTRGTVS